MSDEEENSKEPVDVRVSFRETMYHTDAYGSTPASRLFKGSIKAIIALTVAWWLSASVNNVADAIREHGKATSISSDVKPRP